MTHTGVLFSQIIALLLTSAGGGTAWGQACGHWRFVDEAGPGLRTDHVMVYDSVRQETILFGGWDGSNTREDTWAWDGIRWSLRASEGPLPRGNAAMAFDSRRGVAVLFGGQSEGHTITNDTWEWDGQQWTQVATDGPSARVDHSMTYDSRRGVTVLYGSINNESNETWEWDGSVWTLRTTAGPGLRRRPNLVYDERRGVTVLHGGHQGWGTRRDTWEWDGATWTPVATEGPIRESACVAFDSHRGRVLLHAGQAGSTTFYDDTWEWDGERWTELIADGPYARTNAAMAYDAARDNCVMFGGWDYAEFDTTWIWKYDFWVENQPEDEVVALGRRGTFHVGVSGETVNYQWRRDGLPLEDFGTISGSHTANLSISRAAANDAGRYDCVLSRAGFEPIICDAASLVVVDPVLTINADCPDGGAILVDWRGAAPEGEVALVFAWRPGSMRIPPGHPCAGIRLGVDPSGARVIAQTESDAMGRGQLQGEARSRVCGAVMQLIDVSTCTTSNVAVIE